MLVSPLVSRWVDHRSPRSERRVLLLVVSELLVVRFVLASVRVPILMMVRLWLVHISSVGRYYFQM